MGPNGVDIAIKALTSADPPARKKIPRETTALVGLHEYIDAMITADPQITIAAIWERLADEHGAAIAYPTLRAYITSQRGQRGTRVIKLPGPGRGVRPDGVIAALTR